MSSIFKKIGKTISGIFKWRTGEVVKDIVLNETDAAVVALKNSSVGGKVATIIEGYSSSSASSSVKFSLAVAATVPLVIELLDDKARNLAGTEIESIARALVQSVFNDVKSNSAGFIASLVLKALKVL